MGERFRQERAAAFQQQQCRAYQLELGTANLFSRNGDVLERSYCCESRVPIAAFVGEQVLVQPHATGVRVLHGNVEVGELTGDDATVVAEAIADEPHCPGYALAVIDDASAMTGEFQIRLVDHSEDR